MVVPGLHVSGVSSDSDGTPTPPPLPLASGGGADGSWYISSTNESA